MAIKFTICTSCWHHQKSELLSLE
uniref:Uncharacterized protein n=1 Tax=Arundo donax TaxID=35708 RepID=A0A0A9CCB5_ARUDO